MVPAPFVRPRLLFMVITLSIMVVWSGSLPAVSHAEEKGSILTKHNLKLYGYAQASYTQNFNNPANKVNHNSVFRVDSNSFRPHLAQLVFEKEGKTGGSLEDAAGFRVKLNFGEDSQFTGGTDFDDEVDFQEVYGQFIVPVGNGLDLRIGRMNTLIGFEVIESPLNLNFSRSWLFGFGQPFTTTGVRLGYTVNEYVGFAVGAINSFTGTTSDTDNSKSVEAAVFLTPTENVGLTLYGFWGPEGTGVGQGDVDRVLGGGILTLQATEQLGFVVEGYYANQANSGTAFTSSGNSRWNGAAGYVVYDFTDQWGLRVRGEIFEDAGGTQSCFGAAGTRPNAGVCFNDAAQAQTLWETTFTLQYKPVPSVITRAEFRYDKSDKNTFQFGTRSANHQETLAFEAIYLF